ncbi:MAG: acyl--CoA ligase [Corallococcus sp.]|nr:acyl--CoA ligase [Corallococcus sp.]MCM1358940.1 acyl--CoA ligase [Corallococcus sp.]MCM1394928.1 acyl--CoA ligase [Corallococcus sp.]
MSQTCYEMLIKGANKNGCIVYYNHKVAMSRFLRDIDKCAAGFVKLGLVKGDVVTLYLPSCIQSLAAFYACSKLGLVANVVHPLIPLGLLTQNLNKTHSKALLFYDALVRNEKPLLALGQKLVRCSVADYVTFRKPFYKLYASAIGSRVKGVLTYKQLLRSNKQTQVCGCGEDVVCYMHSGGTGGSPKIVKLTNDAFNGTAEAMILMYKPCVSPQDYNLATLPIFHAYGLCAAMHTPLCFGCNLILVPQFAPKAVHRYLKKYKITIWSVVPAMLKKMIAAKKFDGKYLKDLDVIWCGGDVLDESMVESVNAVLAKYCTRAQLMRGYGLTETCGVCVVNNYFHYKKGSCGMPMPTCDARILDEQGNDLPAGQVGEIAIYSRGNMQGYLDGEDCLTECGGKTWVLTGDLGYLDEQGFLYMVDRKKRMLKIAAVNVFPAEIENCVKTLDFVDEACAVGCKADGKQYVKVYVTLRTPVSDAEAERQVVQICRERLIKYSVPRFVEVLPQMPRTGYGKIDFKSLENK